MFVQKVNAKRATLLLTAIGVSGLAALLFFFAPEQHAFYPRCMLYTLTGWQCPGCGGLRATHHLLHGRFVTAFHYNPLLLLLLPILGIILISHLLRAVTGRSFTNPFQQTVWIWLLLIVVLLFGILRNLPLDALTVFQP